MPFNQPMYYGNKMAVVESNSSNPMASKIYSLPVNSRPYKRGALIVWAALLLSYCFYLWANDLSILDSIDLLINFLTQPYGLLLYCALYLIRPFLFVPISLLIILGASLLNPLLGLPLTYLLSIISEYQTFGIGRILGRGILTIEQKPDNDTEVGLLHKYQDKMQRHGFAAVLTAHLIHIPSITTSYLAGFFKVRSKPFLIATALGSIPGFIAYYLFGASIDLTHGITKPHLNPWILALSIVIALASFWAARLYKKR